MVWRMLDDVTAEAGFEIEADSLEGLIRDAVQAFGRITADSIKFQQQREVEIDFSDPTLGLYDLLDHLVFLKDTEGLVFGDADVKMNGNSARIILKGCKLEDAEPLADIKSPTFHNLNVRKNSKWKVRVVVDI